ncbi:hypothetical protein Agub_g9058 [Astrephomene gubernaculifera]|uniref:Uncharacterized protein n=1 Tax=Astrephomene gubernaculifera TaxID=47775 RepID=A0AAD3DT07_9CHLO|nr:hypothetical protein Agub_g9058 [Astrephomene gubernaculifera]
MGVIIGVVVGTLLMAFLVVLGCVCYNLTRERKRRERHRAESQAAVRMAYSDNAAAATSSPCPPGVNVWTTIHEGIVGVELDDSAEGGSQAGLAPEGDSSSATGREQQHNHQLHKTHMTHGRRTPAPPQQQQLGSSMMSRLRALHAAWVASFSWDWRQQLSAPLDPLVFSSPRAGSGLGTPCSPSEQATPQEPGLPEAEKVVVKPATEQVALGDPATCMLDAASASVTSTSSAGLSDIMARSLDEFTYGSPRAVGTVEEHEGHVSMDLTPLPCVTLQLGSAGGAAALQPAVTAAGPANVLSPRSTSYYTADRSDFGSSNWGYFTARDDGSCIIGISRHPEAAEVAVVVMGGEEERAGASSSAAAVHRKVHEDGAESAAAVVNTWLVGAGYGTGAAVGLESQVESQA